MPTDQHRGTRELWEGTPSRATKRDHCRLGHKAKGAFLMAQMVTSLPAMQKTVVRFLGQEDPLEKGTATYASIFAWRIPWTEEPGWLQSMGVQRVGHN